MQLTQHFSFEELRIPTDADSRIIENAMFLCAKVLEPIRAFIEDEMIITSGLRSDESNKQTHGVKNSQHLFLEGDAAVDWYPHSKNTKVVFDQIRLKLKPEFVDQLILEYNGTGQPIIHVSTNRFGEPRQEVLIGATHNSMPYQRLTNIDKTRDLG